MIMRLIRKMWMILCIAILVSCSKTKSDKKETMTELPFHEMNLSTLTEFKEAQDWKVVGDVQMNRRVDFQADAVEGENIIVSEHGKRGMLTTAWQHGDCDLKLDFMLSRGSEVSLLFQNKYKILFTDSWNKDSIGACGVISIDSSKVILPLLNVCKSPGLWQHVYIKFKASKVDDAGKKISNAVFEEVYLNNKLIHKNVEMVFPKSSSAETEMGPLSFVSEEGPVAIRNIQYKAYKKNGIKLSNIKFAVYKGLFKKYDTLKNFEPLRTGTTDSLHWSLGDKRAQLTFSGTMNVPQEGNYLFSIRAGGSAWLLIDDKEIVNNRNTRDYTRPFYGETVLKKGDHSFQIIYANYDESLVVQYEGPDMQLTSLTSPSSERRVNHAPPMEYKVTTEPGLQRGFFTHHGKVNTYTMSVGIPGGINYAYDLTTFNLLTVWRGRFIDVSNMWEERGESQMEIPLGAPLELSGIPSLLQLPAMEDDWVDTVVVDHNQYTDRGYRLQKNGLPIFLYSYKGIRVEDYMSHDNAALKRVVTLVLNEPEQNCYFLLGSGKRIEKLTSGGYAIDDKEYFIDSISGVSEKEFVVVQTKNGRYELLLPITGTAGQSVSFNYSIIW